MKEKPLFWPQVDIGNVDPNWWDEVMQTTARFQEHLSPELDDAADFTIRGIIHIIVTKDREDIEWFLEGSVQADRVLAIHDLLHSDESGKKQQGQDELVKLIQEYTQDVMGNEGR